MPHISIVVLEKKIFEYFHMLNFISLLRLKYWLGGNDFNFRIYTIKEYIHSNLTNCNILVIEKFLKYFPYKFFLLWSRSYQFRVYASLHSNLKKYSNVVLELWTSLRALVMFRSVNNLDSSLYLCKFCCIVILAFLG